MAEIRKLLNLTKTTYAVTIPNKYKETLKLHKGNYVAISLYDANTLMIRKQPNPSKV